MIQSGNMTHQERRPRNLDWLVACVLVPAAAVGAAIVGSNAPHIVGSAVEHWIEIGWFLLAPCLSAGYLLLRRRRPRHLLVATIVSAAAAPALLVLTVIVLFMIAAAHCPPDAYECPV
jgi:hypothetical protein